MVLRSLTSAVNARRFFAGARLTGYPGSIHSHRPAPRHLHDKVLCNGLWALHRPVEPKGSASTTVSGRALLALAAATAGGVAVAHADSSHGDEDGNASAPGASSSNHQPPRKGLSMNEARSFMANALGEARQKHCGRAPVGSMRCPAVRLEADPNNSVGLPEQAPPSPPTGSGGDKSSDALPRSITSPSVRTASFALPPRTDGFRVLSALAVAMNSPLALSFPAPPLPGEAGSNTTAGGGEDKPVLTLQLPGNSTASLWGPGVRGSGVLSVASDAGLGEQELGAVAAAYAAAVASANAAMGPSTFQISPRSGHMSRGAQTSGNSLFGGGQSNGGRLDASDSPQKGQPMSESEAMAALEGLGLEVFVPGEGADALSWDDLAGAESLKDEIEGTVVLALQDGEAFDAVARLTRARFESNRPRAVLFEGPPGTGKTLTARILAAKCGRPLVQLKAERVLSKWYGESTKLMAQVFDAVEALGAVLFIDEVDALAGSRGSSSSSGGGGSSGHGGGDPGGGGSSDMHEATRRLLSVILQRVDGLEGPSKATLVCATNRRQDLDPALLSRFDLTLNFGLPNAKARRAVVQRYAKQLSEAETQALAEASSGLSCRDLKEVCEHAERRWVAKIIRKQVPASQATPPVEEYLACVQHRTTRGLGSADEPSSVHQL